MTVKHTIQKRFDLPIDARELAEYAGEVINNREDAPINATVHMGGHQLDQHPVAVTFTASWES